MGLDPAIVLAFAAGLIIGGIAMTKSQDCDGTQTAHLGFALRSPVVAVATEHGHGKGN